MSSTPPFQIKGFRVGERIGSGGFAVVWAGARIGGGAPVALKVGVNATRGLVERFRREAAAIQQVGSPYVPRFHDAGQLDDGRPWIAMERLFGRTLEDEIAGQPGPLPLARALSLADGLLAALGQAHALGIIHRDVKPDNVFLPEGGTVVLLDFGLTKGMEGASGVWTRDGAVVGTPEYTAPEQLRGEPTVDARADVYACGVILYRLLTARLPFEGDTGAIEHGHLALRPPRPSRLAPVPAAVEALLLACLAKDPSRRPADARALGRALAVATADEGAPRSSPRSAPATIRGNGQKPAVVLLADTRAPMPAVVAAISDRRGFVAWQRGSRYVAVFSAQNVELSLSAAHAAAREIVERLGGRAALCVSNVTIRPSQHGSLLVSGAVVDRPESWAPPEPWSGVVVGPSAGSTDGHLPLFGREATLAALAASAAPALDGECPGLFVLCGEAGVGKSRLALEAAAVARSCRAGARVVVLRPGGGEEIPAETTALLCLAVDASADAPSDIEAFCKERLGDAVGAETWPSVAAALGWRAGVPQRRGLVRAITAGLRRRARREPIVVILDDAHRADEVVLEAIEAATLDGAGIALWAVVTVLPWFEELRPQWGARTERFAQATLAPLDEAAAAALAAELLRPAEYLAEAALRRLAQWSGGNARCLTEIVQALKQAGVAEGRPSTDAHHFTTADLERVSSVPAWQWVATQSLAALPPDLAALTRVCAVLGASFTREELEWVQDAADREGSAGAAVDADFGLPALVEQGILQAPAGARYAFATRMIRHAVVEMIDPRHRRTVHGHALAYWRARVAAAGATPDRLEPLAAHAVAVEAWEEAADAYLRLGDLALATHRHLEAESHFTAALERSSDARRRAAALLGRGRCRYRLHRPRESVEDLAAAREAAAELADDARVVEILLEEATALDWAEDFAGSALRVGEAAALLARLTQTPGLALCLVIGQARTAMRRGDMRGAAELLERALAGAGAGIDYHARIVALVLLPVALVFSGRLDDAEARFREVIDLATKVEDWPHVGQSYINRALLWCERKQLAAAEEDMSRTLHLAREIGNPFLERQATLNVAEMLHGEGRHWEALALARRALLLDQRFLGRPPTESSLLVARILIAGDDHAQAARIVDGIVASGRTDALTPNSRAFGLMLQRVLGELPMALHHGPLAGWDQIVADARGKLLAPELLELLYWRARTALRGGRRAEAAAAFAEASPLLCDFPAWRQRFEALPTDAST